MKKLLLTSIAATSMALCSAQPVLENGWTSFTPSPDSRIIYVSDSEGDDATGAIYSPSSSEVGPDVFDPSGEIMSYQTISAAMAQVRYGHPDYILFKRGDSWTDQSFGIVILSGRSAAEPMVIGSYGDGERPRILTGNSSGIVFNNFSGTEMTRHVALTDLYLEPHTRAHDATIVGVTLWREFSEILIENCVITGFFQNFVCHGDNSTYLSETRENLRFRRCIITDAYTSGSAHANAFFIDHVNGILMEECLLDHNGWNEAVVGADPTPFRHNSYFQVHNADVTFRNNIVARASATGIGLRCGGIIQDNLVLQNTSNILLGTSETTISWPAEGVTGRIEGNVVLEAREESFSPGQGIRIHQARNVEVVNNIVAHQRNPVLYPTAIDVSAGYESINLHDNIVYNWGQNIPFGPETFYSTNAALNLGSGALGLSMITDNQLQQKNGAAGSINTESDYSYFSFSGNTYFSDVPNRSFENGGMSYPAWIAATGESGSEFTELNYENPERDISTYLASLGTSGSLDDFLSQARLQEKQYWREDFAANRVICYIRQGYVLPFYSFRSQDTLIAPGTMATFNLHGLPASYSVSFNGDAPVQQNAFQVFPSGTTTYEVSVTDSSQAWLMCEPLTLEWTVTVDPVTGSSVSHAENLIVYPNPSSGTLFIESSGGKFDTALVRIKEMTGRLVYETHLTGHQLIIDDQNLEGMYLIEVHDQQGAYKSKVVFNQK